MSNEEQTILVEDATLSTVAIEVKVLRIGKRQMTQAVFRQLPERSVIDDDGNVHGTPWGHVNYHNGCTGEPHLHVIWQDDSVLRHAAVHEHAKEAPRHRELRNRLDHTTKQWLLVALVEGWRPRHEWQPPDNWERGKPWPYASLRLTVGHHAVDVDLSDAAVELIQDSATLAAAEARDAELRALYARDRPGQQIAVGHAASAAKRLAEMQREVERERVQICGETPRAEIQAAMNQAEAALQAYEDNYRASYARLAALDQLFIAV